MISPTHSDSYFRWKVQELYSLLMQARSIVSNNKLYLGLFAENILRTFLSDTLPKRFGVCQGFVENNGNLSQQCDIIIYDQHNYAPKYSFGEIMIVPSVAVHSVIEVKTNISSKTFQDTLSAFRTLNQLHVNDMYLFLYDGPCIRTIHNYFFPKRNSNKFDSIHIGEPLYDNGDEYRLPTAILNLKRNYYLKQDFTPDGMFGYLAYESESKDGKPIACLQVFVQSILHLLYPSSEDDKEFPVFENNISEQKNVELKQIEGFTLFRR